MSSSIGPDLTQKLIQPSTIQNIVKECKKSEGSYRVKSIRLQYPFNNHIKRWTIDIRKKKFQQPVNVRADIIIKIGKQTFFGEKNVLSKGSPLLEFLLNDKLFQENTLRLPEEFVNPEIFEELLNLFYKGRIQMTNENIEAFLKAAHYLDIDSLFHLCEMIIINAISDESAHVIYRFARSSNIERIKKYALKHLAKQHHVYPKNVFQDLCYEFSAEDFKIVLNEWKEIWISSYLYSNNSHFRMAHYRCIIDWVEYDKRNREKYRYELLHVMPECYWKNN